MLTAKGNRDLQRRDGGASELGSLPLKNPKHEKLAREYAAGASMADAWRAIGYDPEKNNNAWRTFQRPEIQSRVEYLRAEFNKMAGISLAALQARYLRFADANVLRFFEADERGEMRLRDLTKLPSAITGPITELNVDKDGGIKLKLVDKLHALDSLAKTIGAFASEKDPGRGVTLEELVQQSMTNRQPVAIQVVTNVPQPRDDENADMRESPAQTQTDGRRVRLDKVKFRRSI
jgi:Terminase small subunit